MAYASITYTSASGTTFALTNSEGDPIPYLRQADITVTVNGTVLTQGTGYTFNAAGTAIVLASAVSGATVIISRSTSIADATVVYTAGSTLTAQDLNNADNQIRYGLQEFSDTYAALTTGTGDLQALGGFIGSAETWVSDNGHAATTGAIDGRVDSKIDTALTTDVVAGNAITITDNSPGSGQITVAVTNGAIDTAELANASVVPDKLAANSVITSKIADGNVTTAKINDLAVTTAKLANDSVTSAKIADGTIIAGDLANDAVTTAKILDANVTTGKIADLAVTTGKLADSSVTSAKIADGTIVAGDLASDSVTTAKILDANVTTPKIADSNVTTGKIADSAVTAIKIADGVITSAKLNASTVVTAAEQSASTPDDTSFFTTSASDNRYDARYVNVTGDTMSGALAMGNNKITGLGTPTANADAATKLYVDNSVAAGVGDADYGDITVSGTGTVWTIDNGVVTSAKIANGVTVNHDLGSASTPSVTFTGDLNTGIYSPGADQVAISSNGVGRLFIASDGKIGVATSSPGSALQVNGAGGIRINEDGAGTKLVQLRSDYASQGPAINVFTNDPLLFLTNNTERMRLDSSGRLGLGTSSASALFHVAQDSSDGTQARITGATNQNYQLRWGFDTTNLVGRIQSIHVGTAYKALALNPDGGNVGIGTASPGELLHIVNPTTTAELRMSGGTTAAAYSQIGFYGSTTRNAEISANSAFLNIDHVNSGVVRVSTGGSERARIDSSGRLLVGTSSSPSAGGGQYSLLVVQGYQGLATGGGDLSIQRGQAATAMSSGTDLGYIKFNDNAGNTFAHISAIVDATPGSSYPGRLVFSTTADGASSPTERMRIIQKGHVKISSNGAYNGATDDYHEIRQTVSNTLLYCSHTFNFGATGGNFGQVIDFAAHSPDNNSSSFLTCKDSTANRMFIYSDGDVWTSDAGTLTSDATLKRDITDASPKLADVMNLRVRNFYWQEDYHPNKQDKKLIGFVAQEFEEVFPGLVSEHRIKGGDPIFDEDGNDTGEKTPEVFKKGIKEAKLVPILVKALQEAVERIEALEAKVAALEAA